MFNLGNLLDRTGFLPESPASGGSSSSSSSGERKSNKNVEKAETSTEGIGDTSGAGSEGTFNDDEASAEAARAAAAEAAAAHWFAQAAALNHVEAHHALALMEVSGRGVPQDLPSAARRLRKVLLLAQPPPPLSASASPSASASASSSGKNHRRRNRRGNEEEIDRREKEEADDDDSGEMIEEEEVTKSAIETSKTNSFLNAQYLLGILALKGELNNIEDGFSLLDGIVPGQTSSSSSSSTVSGEASAVNLVAAGVRLIRAAAQSGHLQVRQDQSDNGVKESCDSTNEYFFFHSCKIC
jgi:TPR repeat protein